MSPLAAWDAFTKKTVYVSAYLYKLRLEQFVSHSARSTLVARHIVGGGKYHLLKVANNFDAKEKNS